MSVPETTPQASDEEGLEEAARSQKRTQRRDFSDFFNQEIAAAAGGADQRRRKFVWIGLALVLAGFVMPIVGVTGSFANPLVRLAMISFFLPAWLVAWYLFLRARSETKAFLVHSLCTYFNLNYSWRAKGFPFQWFGRLRLIPNYDRKSLEDYVSGEHDGVTIQVCDAHLEEEHETRDSKTGDTTTWRETVFRGLLCCFSFPKDFSGHTIVTNDRGDIGNWFAKFSMPGERVHLEDPRFEDCFAVYSTDQVEARYLLTPGFMERLLEFSGHAGPGQLRLAFDANHIFIALNEGRDFFEVRSALKSVSNPAQVSRLYDEFRLMFYMIEILGLALKTRI